MSKVICGNENCQPRSYCRHRESHEWDYTCDNPCYMNHKKSYCRKLNPVEEVIERMTNDK